MQILFNLKRWTWPLRHNFGIEEMAKPKKYFYCCEEDFYSFVDKLNRQKYFEKLSILISKKINFDFGEKIQILKLSILILAQKIKY